MLFLRLMLKGWLYQWSLGDLALFHAGHLDQCDVPVLQHSLSALQKDEGKQSVLVNLQNFLCPPMLAKVRLAMTYVARGITPLSQWVVSGLIESSYLTFLSSSGCNVSGQSAMGLHVCAWMFRAPQSFPLSENRS